MEFTYSGDPTKSTKDEVRFLIGDTDVNSPQLGDSEILYAISSEGNALLAAVACATALQARYSRLSDESVGDVSKSYSQRADAFEKLAKALRRRNAERSVCPYAGGISKADKETNVLDEDRVDNAFNKELHNNPRSGSNTEYDPCEP